MGWEVSPPAASTAHALTTGRTTHPIVDADGRVIGLLAGEPQDTGGWGRVCKEAADAIESARVKCVFTDKQIHHRRGEHPALAMGITHGTGTLVSPACCTLRASGPNSPHTGPM
jgi:hypothetical protein